MPPSNGCEKIPDLVILSEAKNLSGFLCLRSDRREILRFASARVLGASAQNDNARYFSRSLVMLALAGIIHRGGRIPRRKLSSFLNLFRSPERRNCGEMRDNPRRKRVAPGPKLLYIG